MVDDDTEAPWDGQTVGELEARGPWVAASYHQPEDDANEDKFHQGWLRTGDVGRMFPDGTLEIVDRVKDLVKSGGEWISSVELERALASHPAVRESAVVAIPNERWGERPAALVVLIQDGSATADELKEFLATKVASWQVPDVIEFIDDLPKTGVGKIDKRRLRDEVVPNLVQS
jgi:fatty-acyl-CoA synthase